MSTDIANAVQEFFQSVDSRDWDTTISLMSNPYHLDYSSFGAGPAADMAPVDVINGWKSVLPGFDFTHHQLSPLIIEETGDTASVRAYVTATHQISEADGGETWTVYGSYIIPMVREEGKWKLAGNTFKFKFLTGNSDLPQLAQQRASNL